MASIYTKPRAIIWFIKSFVNKKKRYILLSSLAGFLLSLYFYSGFSLSARAIFIPENSVGMVGRYNLTNLPLSVQNKVSLGLTKMTEDDRATPSAAISWEVKDNGRKYDFKLNPNLKWHDGTTFRSFDVNYRLKDVEIVALGNSMVEFRLKEPFSALPSILSQPILKNKLTGLGDYRVINIIWDGDLIKSIDLINTKNSQDRIIYKFYATNTEAITALKLKKIARIEQMTSIDNITGVSDFNITPSDNLHNFVALFFNTQKGALSEKQTRLGLAYAVPDETIAGFTEVNGPISKSSWYYNNNLKDFTYNLEQAKKYLKNLLEKNEGTSSAEFKIKLDTLPLYKTTADLIAQSWNKVGIKTTVEVKNEVTEDFDVFLGALKTLPDPDQYDLWHSTRVSNISNLKSPRVDKILEDARRISDPKLRKEAYSEFQKYLVEELPALFLYYQKTYTITRL